MKTLSHLACGEVSHIVTISDNVVLHSDDDSKYFIDGLESNTLHNITVAFTYNNNGSRIFNQSVRTSSSKCKYQTHKKILFMYVHIVQLYNFFHCCNKHHNILVAPNPIDFTSILIEKISRNSVRIMWKVYICKKKMCT